MNYKIRPIKEEEILLLPDFLYEAIFQRDESNPIPRSVIEQPEVKVSLKISAKRMITVL